MTPDTRTPADWAAIDAWSRRLRDYRVGASKSEHHAGTPRPHSRDPKSTGLGAPSPALTAG